MSDQSPVSPASDALPARVVEEVSIGAELDAAILAAIAAQDCGNEKVYNFVIDGKGRLYAGRAMTGDGDGTIRVGMCHADDQTAGQVTLGSLTACFAQTAADERAKLAAGWVPENREALAQWNAACAAKAPSENGEPVPPPGVTQRAVRVSVDTGPFTGSPEQLDILRSHVVNLERGALSDDGLLATTQGDLDTLAERIAAECGAGGKTLLLYAHGGLTDERYGLASAWAYYKWWIEHGIYPVFFVWETGALETLWQIVGAKLGRTRAVTRDVFDYTTDPVVEAIAKGPGTVLWQAMKDSAALASQKDGGATQFVQALDKAGAKPNKIVAIGHSAGSIFHAHFLPMLKGAGHKTAQVHLLAPAMTRPLFAATLAKLDTEITMFSMNRSTERADNCGNLYRKSLLYLVSRAFERGDGQAILGLQEFWKDDPKVATVFGPTAATAKPSAATNSRSHGGFDNDPATMEAVLLRIKGLADATVAPQPRFPSGQVRSVRAALPPPNYYGFAAADMVLPAPVQPPPDSAQSGPAPETGATAASVAPGTQRFALCIGNDGFPGEMRLTGCIQDANHWAETFRAAGFTAEALHDATGAQMRATIRSYAARCAPGDTLAIHISSHGTQVRDDDGDEREDNRFADDLDEAVLGIDWETGGLVIDDEWPGLLAARPGAHIVRFHDFCHAGRTTRMLLRPGRKVRSVRLKDTVAQRAVTELGSRAARAAPSYGQDAGYLTFCACQPHQLAAEENGMGLFSRAATALLRGQGAGMSAAALAEAIGRGMAGAEQLPMIEGPDSMQTMPIFGR